MKVIITGSTGMLGKGLLLECIDTPSVKQVLLINRNSVKISHPKVKEIIHHDFLDFTPIKKEIEGYDICYHCMGVSAAGLSESKYTQITYESSKSLATTLYRITPNLVFCYISGAGTDSSEKGSMMWARVKGKTENMILSMGFKDAYALRPGAILPERGLKSRTPLYNIAYAISRPFFPLMKKMSSVTTTTKLAQAMLKLYSYPQDLKHLEGADINKVAAIK